MYATIGVYACFHCLTILQVATTLLSCSSLSHVSNSILSVQRTSRLVLQSARFSQQKLEETHMALEQEITRVQELEAELQKNVLAGHRRKKYLHSNWQASSSKAGINPPDQSRDQPKRKRQDPQVSQVQARSTERQVAEGDTAISAHRQQGKAAYHHCHALSHHATTGQRD